MKIIFYQSVQFSCSVVSDSVTPWTVARQASLSFTISQSLIKLMSIESVMPSNHLILCHPLLLLPSIFPSIRVFSKEKSWPLILRSLQVQGYVQHPLKSLACGAQIGKPNLRNLPIFTIFEWRSLFRELSLT